MNKITIELCAEDRARIDRLTAAMETRTQQVEEYLAGNYEPRKPEETTPTEPKNEPEKAEPGETNEHPAEQEPMPWGEPEPVQEAEAPTVTAQELQKKVVDLCAKGMKDKVRAIVNAYAAKVSDIPEDKRGEVYEQLTALEG